ncbi:hypothetical protein [Actinomyces sp. S4-C9]|uniref:hypothetical protein n=1 Tax=Actinomyces sp. S4-C9 TaxID=1219581 RepID=UPI000B04F309|nr:hypothetical protein [Actinomyces sp. S4-C9]
MKPDLVNLRLALLALAGASLLGGLNAGLVALGVWAPVRAPRFADIHGIVMSLGFMGTVIALERAQSLRQTWAYLAPATIGAGSIALILGYTALGQLLLIQGTALFVLTYIALWKRAPLPLLVIQIASALMVMLASTFWVLYSIEELIPLLVSYIVLTIASERVELAALTMKGASHILAIFTLPLTLLPIGTLIWPYAVRPFGATLTLLAIWLLKADIVRKTIRTTGLYRYNAAALATGYIWLIAAGLTWICVGKITSGATYDLTIHATFIGFGMSMIMAHAPVIFPAVIARPLPYHPVLWAPLALLQLGLIIRFAGYLTANSAAWHLGAIINIAAILLFAITSVSLVVLAGRIKLQHGAKTQTSRPHNPTHTAKR